MIGKKVKIEIEGEADPPGLSPRTGNPLPSRQSRRPDSGRRLFGVRRRIAVNGKVDRAHVFAH